MRGNQMVAPRSCDAKEEGGDDHVVGPVKRCRPAMQQECTVCGGGKVQCTRLLSGGAHPDDMRMLRLLQPGQEVDAEVSGSSQVLARQAIVQGARLCAAAWLWAGPRTNQGSAEPQRMARPSRWWQIPTFECIQMQCFSIHGGPAGVDSARFGTSH